MRGTVGIPGVKAWTSKDVIERGGQGICGIPLREPYCDSAVPGEPLFSVKHHDVNRVIKCWL